MISSKQVKETQQGSFTPIQDGSMGGPGSLTDYLRFSFIILVLFAEGGKNGGGGPICPTTALRWAGGSVAACGERSLQSDTRPSFSSWSEKVWTPSLLIIGKILCWRCIFLSEVFLHFQANLLVLHCLGALMNLLAPRLTYPHNIPFISSLPPHFYVSLTALFVAISLQIMPTLYYRS